jgi:hypothetical protein
VFDTTREMLLETQVGYQSMLCFVILHLVWGRGAVLGVG